MNEELKQFNINIEDIEENNNLFNNIQEAIDKLRKYTLKDRFEVVLNNNLIESKEKLTNYRTILGCRISYDNLDKNISFIVREDEKPTYEELQQQLGKYKNVIDKIKEYVKENIRYYDDELGLVEIMGAGATRIPVLYLYGLLELLEEVE